MTTGASLPAPQGNRIFRRGVPSGFFTITRGQVVAVTEIEKEVSMGVFLAGAMMLGFVVGLIITGLLGVLAYC